MVIELLKHALIDVELLRYRQSLIVAAIFSAVFEIKLQELII